MIKEIENVLLLNQGKDYKSLAKIIRKEMMKGKPKRKYQSEFVKYDIDNRILIKLPEQISTSYNSFTNPNIKFNKDTVLIEMNYKKEK